MKPHLGKRFYLGWVFSSLTMFGLYYVWHGLFLNDFELLPYSLSIYLSAAAVVYLLIGFLLSRAFISPFFDKIARHPVLRGPAVGFGVGVMVYLVAMVVHVTFNKDLDFRYLLLDITWQGVEEALGGLVVGIVYLVVFENVFHPVPEENDHEDQ